MQRFTKRRVGGVAGAMVAAGLCLGSIGVATAGAGAAPAAIRPAHIHGAKSHSSTFTGGTYNLFIGCSASGTITFKADNSWSASEFADVGSWEVLGKTIVLGDTASSESANGSVWIATVEKGSKHLGPGVSLAS